MQNYLEAVTSVIRLMKQPDSPCKNIEVHNGCYLMFSKHMITEDIPFSMDAALDWLETVRARVSHTTYSLYRNALFRLEHYLMFGDIHSPLCRSEKCFFCRSGMSESFFRLTYELEKYHDATQNPCYYHTYSVAIKDFFRLATAMGITEPEAITIDALIKYWDDYCVPMENLERRRNAVCAMTSLMKYLNQRGDVPSCFCLVLSNGNAEKVKAMRLKSTGSVFHPSLPLESKAKAYLSALGEWKFKDSSLELYRCDFYWYFLFLEINHIVHSAETIKSWKNVLTDYPNQKQDNCSVRARRIHTIELFNTFLDGDMKSNRVSRPSLASEALPEWSQHILKGFLESRQLDGTAKSTLTMCHSAGCSFFLYLDRAGIRSPGEITPEIIKAFHNQDEHSTPESKNAYSIKLRQLLNYMAEQELVSPTLAYAVSTASAPRRCIVDVLSEDAVMKIYEYREKATSPLELRDTAIVMLGLRMGIRGIDILHLQINDFNWKSKTVSFVQQKTRKAITLPVPTDVANSVCKYILQGRPKSADAGKGYIFIRHQAPYIPFSDGTVTCKSALKRILSACGVELKHGQGFHMTRKTFATRMLQSDNRIDDISNALGHTNQRTAEVYLERDEDHMRLCPLEFGGVL